MKHLNLNRILAMAATVVITGGLVMGTVQDFRPIIWIWEADAAHDDLARDAEEKYMVLAAEIKSASAVAHETHIKILYDRLDGNLVRKDQCIADQSRDCAGLLQRVRDLQQSIKKAERELNSILQPK